MAAPGVKCLGSLALGWCLPSLRHNASKVKINYLYFDQKLLKHFQKFEEVYAHDPEKLGKAGDVVLVRKLPKKISMSITHEVLEVVYPCGDITDPITGKKVISSRFRDEIDAESELFGKRQSAFNYEKAPKRGWQEDKRDFTHRQMYVKYHEFPEGDENKDQPHSTNY